MDFSKRVIIVEVESQVWHQAQCVHHYYASNKWKMPHFTVTNSHPPENHTVGYQLIVNKITHMEQIVIKWCVGTPLRQCIKLQEWCETI